MARCWQARVRAVGVAVSLGGGSLVAVAGAAPPAGAIAPPPPAGCGFHPSAGPVAPGTAGTLVLVVRLTPADPYQDCSAPVSFTAAITTPGGAAPAGVTPDAASGGGTVTFAANRLDPVLRFGWAGYCTAAAQPVELSVVVSGQRLVEPLGTSDSCAAKGLPHSTLDSLPPAPAVSAVGLAATPGAAGYRIADGRGLVTDEGNPKLTIAEPVSNAPVVAITAAPSGDGDWLAAADGGVFTYGSAAFHGSMGGARLNAPVVGMAADPATGGYWLVAADGGVFSFDAPFFGSMGGAALNAPIVGIAAAPGGAGYWLVGADGGVFSFGAAAFHGSAGSLALNAPVVGIAADPATGGYWLAGADGGVFSFDAPFHGSMGGAALNAPVSGITATASGGGYWLAGADGGVFTFGDAPFYGAATSAAGPYG